MLSAYKETVEGKRKRPPGYKIRETEGVYDMVSVIGVRPVALAPRERESHWLSQKPGMFQRLHTQ